MPLGPLAVIVSLLTFTASVLLGSRPAAAAPDAAPAGAVTTAPDGPAQAWVVADMDTGSIRAGKNPTLVSAPASTLNVLLAMTVLDHLDPNAA
ncbi:MAG: D-alanyl-D-alanine carboxypeptidase, partial [Mycobacterium sp.]|nr:D-alanyl-D-alanine carboxypeptidase [Mycobacterium sp.]